MWHLSNPCCWSLASSRVLRHRLMKAVALEVLAGTVFAVPRRTHQRQPLLSPAHAPINPCVDRVRVHGRVRP